MTNNPPSARSDLRISVVIPCYRARKTLPTLIASLAQQTMPQAAFEVIAVDDGSDDGTQEYLASCPGVQLLRLSHGGPGAARQAGLEAARGEFVLYLDADLVASPGLLQAHVDYHQAHPQVGGTSGSVLPAEEYPLLSWAMTDHLCSWFNAHPGVRYAAPPEYLPSLNFCVKRQTVLGRGITWGDGLKTTGEDVLYCRDLRRAGLQLAFLPAAVVRHRDRDTLATYLRHMYRWGEHAPSVRGSCADLKYGWLFPRSRFKLLFTMPLIVAGYSALIWVSWLRFRPLAATLALPQIILGRLSYARGVWQGTAHLKAKA